VTRMGLSARGPSSEVPRPVLRWVWAAAAVTGRPSAPSHRRHACGRTRDLAIVRAGAESARPGRHGTRPLRR
jgi:hypothetical protein